LRRRLSNVASIFGHNAGFGPDSGQYGVRVTWSGSWLRRGYIILSDVLEARLIELAQLEP
jgi:hypothetical protein